MPTRSLLRCLPALCALLSFPDVSAQDCSGLKDGSKLAMEVRSYAALSDHYEGIFYELKPAQQVAEARRYSKALNAGTAKPALSQVIEYAVSGPNAAGEWELLATIGGTEYKSYTACKEGNLYLVRAKGAAFLTYGKDTAGFFTNGVQVLPRGLKTGDLAPGYVDERYFMKSTPEIRKTRFGSGGAPAALLSGEAARYSYSSYLPVTVAGPVESKSIALYQPGVVYGTGSVTVSGKSFDYVKIRTAIWTKVATAAATGEELRKWFADPAFNKQMYDALKSAAPAAQLTARTEDMLGPNKAGYHVTYKEEWIAPGLGMIRSLTYDQWGCLTMAIELKEIR
ncbi:MAG: hypothetical protein EOO11_10905 [Chitinophagaceae bacterium]|nr:MAG: hypothetical protein EOO11_10905 [Chitinophagaceae bacterium]